MPCRGRAIAQRGRGLGCSLHGECSNQLRPRRGSPRALSEGGVCAVVATSSCVRLQTAGDGGPPPDSPCSVGGCSSRGGCRHCIGGGRRACQRKGTGSRFPDRDWGNACVGQQKAQSPLVLIFTGGSRRPRHGDVNEPRDADGDPGEGSLPSLTAYRAVHVLILVGAWAVRAKAPTTLESIRSEIGLDGWQSAPAFGASGASPPVLENLGEVAPAGVRAFVGSLPTRPYS